MCVQVAIPGVLEGIAGVASCGLIRRQAYGPRAHPERVEEVGERARGDGETLVPAAPWRFFILSERSDQIFRRQMVMTVEGGATILQKSNADRPVGIGRFAGQLLRRSASPRRPLATL